MTKSNYRLIAKTYDALRPDYPAALFQTLIKEGSLSKASKLLEIGAGTGKATTGLTHIGCHIDCIEIEASMAELLKKKTEAFDVSVSVDSFENWTYEGTYDFIYSAQAFHWIDKTIKYRKCADCLTPNGKMGLFWYVTVLESEEMFDEIHNIFATYGTGFSSSKPSLLADAFNRERDELDSNGHFENIKEYDYMSHLISQSTDEFINRFKTTSAYETMHEQDKPEVKEALRTTIDKLGGQVLSRVHYKLFICSK